MTAVLAAWAAVAGVSFVAVLAAVRHAHRAHQDTTTAPPPAESVCRWVHPTSYAPPHLCEQIYAAELTDADDLPDHVRQQL